MWINKTQYFGNVPQAVCFDGTNVWIANGRSDNVTVLRASDGAPVRTVSVLGKAGDET